MKVVLGIQAVGKLLLALLAAGCAAGGPSVPSMTVAPLASPTSVPLPPLSGSGGGVIAFGADRSGRPGIWVMNADGSDPRRLTNSPAQDLDPAWQPAH